MRGAPGVGDRLEHARALDPYAARLRSLVVKTTGSRRVRDTLHGVWLGHPAHPALVWMPLGSWTAASLLDLSAGTERAARQLVGAGLVAALPTVATGLTDWAWLHPEQQRVGLVHAMANTVAAGCYAGSYVARAAGRRRRGKRLALAGLAATTVGGWLGGHLAYRQASGPSHAEGVLHRVPADWQEVGRLDQLPEGKPVCRSLGTEELLLLRHGGEVLALADRCAHLDGPLHQGMVLPDPSSPECVVCPWHGSTYDLRTGAVVHGPATSPQPTFDTRVRDGVVQARLRRPS